MQRNRLAAETSPYLQQHADNPVDWYPWGEEALARARREDKPILLSVGYSACHWCHVMAHESFEDAATAEVMNRLFVNIKVDREERPDLDKIYQTAQQLLTQRAGGWPLTMFLTPGRSAAVFWRHLLPARREVTACRPSRICWSAWPSITTARARRFARRTAILAAAFERLQPGGAVADDAAAPGSAALAPLRSMTPRCSWRAPRSSAPSTAASAASAQRPSFRTRRASSAACAMRAPRRCPWPRSR